MLNGNLIIASMLTLLGQPQARTEDASRYCVDVINQAIKTGYRPMWRDNGERYISFDVKA